MGLFGPSKAELKARVEEERERRMVLERARRRPWWVRVLSNVKAPADDAHVMLWVAWILVVLPVVVAVNVAVVVVVFLVAFVPRWTVRAWVAYPRPVTVVPVAAWGVLGGPLWGALPLLALVAGAAWWHESTRPPRPVKANDDVAMWRTAVADGDAPLVPGSTVADHPSPVRTPDGRVCGRVLHVRFRDARQNRQTVEAVRYGIAGLWTTGVEGVTVRAVGDESRADVEILDQWWLDELAEDARVDEAAAQARLREVHVWQPSDVLDLATGRLPLAVAAEDGARVPVQVFVPGEGGMHFWFVGATRRGKSSALSAFIAAVMSTGVARLHLIDLKGGSSLPEWIDHAETYADTVEDAREVIAHIRRTVLDVKVRAMGDQRLKVVNPSEEWPIDLVVVEEAVDITQDRATMDHIDAMARKGGSALVLVVWVTQVGLVDKAFGAAGSGMREQLQSGTVVALWCGPTTRRLSLGGGDGDIDLSRIPKDVKGAVVIASQGGRQVLARTLRIPDDDAVRLADGIAARVGMGRDGGPVTAETLRERTAVPVPAVVSGAGVTVPLTVEDVTAEGKVRDVIRAHGVGVMVKTGRVIEGAQVAPSTFHNVIKRLVRDGLAADLGHGQWAATAALMEQTGVSV